jgi:hypothetical protein
LVCDGICTIAEPQTLTNVIDGTVGHRPVKGFHSVQLAIVVYIGMQRMPKCGIACVIVFTGFV